MSIDSENMIGSLAVRPYYKYQCLKKTACYGDFSFLYAIGDFSLCVIIFLLGIITVLVSDPFTGVF